jgi:hypothetical protein
MIAFWKSSNDQCLIFELDCIICWMCACVHNHIVSNYNESQMICEIYNIRTKVAFFWIMIAFWKSSNDQCLIFEWECIIPSRGLCSHTQSISISNERHILCQICSICIIIKNFLKLINNIYFFQLDFSLNRPQAMRIPI